MPKMEKPLDDFEGWPGTEPVKPQVNTFVLGPEQDRQQLLRALHQQYGASAVQRHPVLPDLGAVRFDALRVRQLDGNGVDAATLDWSICNPEQTERIVHAWKFLREAEEARCHLPGFALDFLLDGEPQLIASICWQCNNIRLSGRLAPADWATFDAQTPAARMLLEYCKEVMLNTG